MTEVDALGSPPAAEEGFAEFYTPRTGRRC
jgi:hypothetical protein